MNPRMTSTIASRIAVVSLALAVGCGEEPSSGSISEPEPEPEPAPTQPAGWDAGVALRPARDKNPDPRIVEVDLTARVADLEFIPGKPTPAWTYDGGAPGPIIRASVGDRVIVHFHNELPEATTVHWHGVRVPADMDGTPGESQPEVPPGGR